MEQVDGFVELADVIGAGETTRTHSAIATVVRTDEEGTVWVRYDGGVDETPVHRCMYAVKPGDTVAVTTRKGRSSIDGNATDIPLSSSGGSAINERALRAITDAASASSAAQTAQSSADLASKAASNAQASADQAQESAETAQTAAEQAISDAADANTAAAEAQASANTANTAADTALVQLSVVQDVAGTLDWISKHGEFVPTEDTEPQEGTVYFEHTDSGWMPVVEPSGNPSEQGWATLDISDSQTAYIMAHLAVTDMGLWVMPSGYTDTPRYGAGYKVLLASDGMRLFDASGKEVIRYGDAVQVASDRAFYIGNEDAYILFTPATATRKASIVIGGANVSIGGDKTLTELLEASAGYRYDYNYTESNGIYTYTGYLTRGTEDISSQVPDGAWWWTLEQEGEHIDLPSGRTLVFQDGMIVNGTAVYRGYNPSMAGGVLDRYEEDAVLVDESGNVFADESGNRLAVGLVWEVA